MNQISLLTMSIALDKLYYISDRKIDAMGRNTKHSINHPRVLVHGVPHLVRVAF